MMPDNVRFGGRESLQEGYERLWIQGVDVKPTLPQRPQDVGASRTLDIYCAKTAGLEYRDWREKEPR